MNIQYKSNKVLESVLLILSLIGLTLVCIALFLLIRTASYNNNSEIIEAIIDDCDKDVKTDKNGKVTITYINFVNYSYNGNSYEHVVLTGLNQERASGDTIRIRISKNNPNDVRFMNQTTFGSVFLLIIGIVICGGFGYLFVINILQKNEYKEIKEKGRKIEATVTKVYPYRNVYNSNNQYFKLDCESMEKVFTSMPYKNGVGISEGDTVFVYYTSLQKNKYFVDVENTIINKKEIGDNWRLK